MKIIYPVLIALTHLITHSANAGTILSCHNGSASLEVIHENFGYRYALKYGGHFYEGGALLRDLADRKPAMTFESDQAKLFHVFGQFELVNKVTNQTDSFPANGCVISNDDFVEPLCEKKLPEGTAYVSLLRKNDKFFLHAYVAKDSVIHTDYGLKEVKFDNYARYTGSGIELHLFMYGMRGAFTATYGLSKLPLAHTPPSFGDRNVEYKDMTCN